MINVSGLLWWHCGYCDSFLHYTTERFQFIHCSPLALSELPQLADNKTYTQQDHRTLESVKKRAIYKSTPNLFYIYLIFVDSVLLYV